MYNTFSFTIICSFFDRFALRGTMFDLAIGFIIGTAFSNVVQSLVNDIITPPFGLLIGGVDFVNLVALIPNFVYHDQPPVAIRYGRFVQQILYLLIVALELFFIVKLINKLQKMAAKKKVAIEETAVKEFSDEVKILQQIRDLLATKIISIHSREKEQ
jgi:large conductance mechanosensitive channel